jgi:hypothetical protein
MRPVIAREHTSLLDNETRLEYERLFKGAETSPNAPNVLVATPTLEMGIDVGDLSTVFLSSLPRTVASYLQRVGRAGRLTGNALNLAYVTGRGDQLPKLGEPLSVINGEVRPPATYLRAEEILRRQYTAHLVDEFAREVDRPHPRRASAAIGSSEPGSFLGDLIAHAETGADQHLARFAAAFHTLPEAVFDELREWLRPTAGPGSSPFAVRVHAASRRWQHTLETLQHRRAAIEKLLPELEAKTESPAKTDDDDRALRSAKAAHRLTLGQLSHLRAEHWIGALEEHGLLPNYTLLDDTVTLDVGLSWIDPDTYEFHSDHAQFQRGSAQALREFAPGARFYARGWEITVDAVDLGMDGASIRPWVFCPACGFATDIAEVGEEKPIPSCPRCGSPGIGDTGQRLDLVELTHVTSEVRRDEAVITDRRDEREPTSFQIVTAADIDPAKIARRWFVEDIGLGCTYLRAMTLRWVNIGPPGHGVTRTIAGADRSGTLFRLCSGCGKLDTDTGHNRPHEHRPWCRYRNAPAEHTTTVALARTLTTQGLLVRLPNAVTIGDDFAVPSLAAALLLGLREQMGGHPDHIRVEYVVDPTLSDGSDNYAAVLLHDAVPGGTGYLADIAAHERLHELLVRAWERLRDCECRDEERLACHRCLLPFVAPGAIRRVSRASAERHLRTLLGLTVDAAAVDPDAPRWAITEIPPPEDPESHLEQRFRKLLVDRLGTLGAALTEVPGPWGNTVRFTLPGGHRQWTLTPQVNLANSRPDFVLDTNDTNVPTVAIFTDGRAFHASQTHNRLADDATKRGILRDAGHVVLAVTAQDVADAEQGLTKPPPWFSERIVGQLITKPSFMAQPAAYGTLRTGPIDWLISWVSAPSPNDIRSVARAVPMFLLAGAEFLSVPPDLPLEDAGRAVLAGENLSGSGDRRVAVRRVGALAAVVEQDGMQIKTALVLDDRDGCFDGLHADAWRQWLRLSNTLALRDWPTTITTVTAATAPAPTPTAAPAPEAVRVQLTGGWADAYQAAHSKIERELILALAAREIAVPPAVGAEGPDGIPLDISWPELRIAVAMPEMPDEDRRDLEAAGWRIVEPEADALVAAVAATVTNREP